MQFATRRPVFVARILLAQVTIPWAWAVISREMFSGTGSWRNREEDEEEIYSGHKAKREDVQLFETLIEA